MLRDRALRRLAPLFRRDELPKAVLFAAVTNALSAALHFAVAPALVSSVVAVVVGGLYARVDWQAVSEEIADGTS